MATITVGDGGDVADWASVTIESNNTYDGQGLTFSEEINFSSVNDVTIINTNIIGNNRIVVQDSDRLNLTNCSVSGRTSGNAIDLRRGDDIVVSGCESFDNLNGINLQECNGGRIDIYCHDNDNDGMLVQLATDDLRITGTFENNGHDTAQSDCDGIGIGHAGGTMTNIVVHDAIFRNNGPRFGSHAKGSGLYVGTANVFTITLDVVGCTFEGNYRCGAFIGNEWLSGDITGNIITGTFGDQSLGGIHLNTTGVTGEGNCCNNVIHDNPGVIAGIRVASPVNGGSCNIQNNIMDNNDGTGFVAEININNTDGSRTTDHNIYNPASGNDVAYELVTAYSTAAAWAAANGGADEEEADPQLDADGFPDNTNLHTSGNKWWTGGNPLDNNGEPFSDWECTVGAIQKTDTPFHPTQL